RRAAGVQNDETEERLLALIMKADYKNEDKCKNKIKEYCNGLKNVSLTSEKVHKELKDFCNDGKEEKKCKELKTKIEEKCSTFKDKLKTKAKEEISKLTDDDCKEHERQCLFLEGACPTDLKEDCNTLRNKCYQKERDNVAEEVLLRALSGSLKKKDSCEEKLKEVCPLLSGESDELMLLCFNEEKTCENIMAKEQNKCKSLKSEIEKVLPKNEELEIKCPSLLRECYFYDTDCIGNEPNCEKLASDCKEKGITYTKPGSDFEPTRPGVTLAEEIELEELYKKAAKKGVRIGRPPTRDATELLLLLSQSSTKSTVVDKCKDILDKKCKNLKEHEILKSLCDKDKASADGKKECDKLQKEHTKSTQILVTKIENKLLITSGQNMIITWHDLSTFLSDKDCRTLESDCFYLKGYGPSDKPCNNLKTACYKKGLEAVANEALQNNLRGLLQGSNKTWHENLQKKIVKACKKLKEESDELFVLCVQPKKAAFVVSTDLRFRAIFLREQLDEKRDFPTETDCKELEEKCRILGQDSKEIKWPCLTLNQHCDRLRNTQELEEKLLLEKIQGLDDFDLCVEKLGKWCNDWTRRGRTRFTLSCVTQNITCKILTERVGSKCARLDEHMKTNNILENVKKNKTETICTFWGSYCSKFMSGCKNLMKANDGKCEELNKECEIFIKKKELELKLVDQLKGHLNTKEKCKGELDKYCTQWVNASNGLETFCTNKKKKSKQDDLRKELCEKLVEQVKKQCPGLKKELTEASKELEKKANKYEDIKKEAKEAMEKANLVLSKAKTTDNKPAGKTVPSESAPAPAPNTPPAAPNTTQNTVLFKLVRRNINTPVTEKIYVTEKELKAFDLVSQAFSLYVELKELCHDSEKGCGFKEECKDIEEACTKIEKTCGGLKPLEIKPHEIVTKNVTTTTTTTTTTTVKDVKATDCQSLQTTDTWVTKTSTHTSTSTTTSTVTSRITLTSTRRCKPTKCTTGEEDEAGEVKPSEGLRMSGWSVMRGVLVVMMISFMI
ncbi:uncharacterized protein T551_01859, partial [Pneumocystis jirovecii RU7]